MVSGKKPGQQEDPAAVEATLEDLAPVESHPALPAVTLDEEPKSEPSATQLLDPVEDVAPAPPRPPRPTTLHTLDVSADAPSAQARRRAALKSDAFESFPTLGPARDGEVRPDVSAPGGDTFEWTPGRVALVVMGVALALVALLLVLRG